MSRLGVRGATRIHDNLLYAILHLHGESEGDLGVQVWARSSMASSRDDLSGHLAYWDAEASSHLRFDQHKPSLD